MGWPPIGAGAGLLVSALPTNRLVGYARPVLMIDPTHADDVLTPERATDVLDELREALRQVEHELPATADAR